MTWRENHKQTLQEITENTKVFSPPPRQRQSESRTWNFKIRKWGLLSLDLEIKHHTATLLKVTQAPEFVQESVKHDKQIHTIPELLKIPTDSFWFCKQSGPWRQDECLLYNSLEAEESQAKLYLEGICKWPNCTRTDQNPSVQGQEIRLRQSTNVRQKGYSWFDSRTGTESKLN